MYPCEIDLSLMDLAENNRTIAKVLLSRASPSDDRFFIFEEKVTGKFVQFASASTELFVLDLPYSTLSTEERKRAGVVLRDYGTVSLTSDAFQIRNIGVELAAIATASVFRNIYLFDGHIGLRISTESEYELSAHTCDRCGGVRKGSSRWMLAPWWHSLVGEGSSQKFICFGCQRVLRIYSTIGLTLLAVATVALTGISIWLIQSL